VWLRALDSRCSPPARKNCGPFEFGNPRSDHSPPVRRARFIFDRFQCALEFVFVSFFFFRAGSSFLVQSRERWSGLGRYSLAISAARIVKPILARGGPHGHRSSTSSRQAVLVQPRCLRYHFGEDVHTVRQHRMDSRCRGHPPAIITFSIEVSVSHLPGWTVKSLPITCAHTIIGAISAITGVHFSGP